ncbi:MAG: hypothetical protein KKA73_05635 [Chloroflexi bacterium]|nr:hypothetical protein [Chloroflexota bacterium]MBU1747149.1 hypothetical protein [Chloroflexota bacterium]
MTDKATDVLRILAGEKDPDLDQAVQLALADAGFRTEMLAGLTAQDDVYRYNCVKVLLQVSEQRPEILYPEWDRFVAMLGSDNSYHRSIALRLIANLTVVDAAGRFEGLFDHYFDLLDDEKIITARYLAQHAGRIARAKPHLQAAITERLLAVDSTRHEQGRKDLLKADVIAAFDEFFAASGEQARILAFVEAQLACSSPKTRKAAKSFLSRHGGESR